MHHPGVSIRWAIVACWSVQGVSSSHTLLCNIMSESSFCIWKCRRKLNTWRLCSGLLEFLGRFLSSPTIRSWWSQWAVMATYLCYSWWRWGSETLWRKSNAYWIFGLKTNLGSNSCTTCMQQAWRAICLWYLEIQAAICSKPGCPNFMSYGMSTMLICNVVTFLFHNLGLFFILWHGKKFLAHCHGSL
jgi:hypothetical protein